MEKEMFEVILYVMSFQDNIIPEPTFIKAHLDATFQEFSTHNYKSVTFTQLKQFFNDYVDALYSQNRERSKLNRRLKVLQWKKGSEENWKRKIGNN